MCKSSGQPIRVIQPVLHTSRKPRKSEVEGRDYFFVSRKSLEEGLASGKYFQVGVFNSFLYAVSTKSVNKLAADGYTVLLQCPLKGVFQLYKNTQVKSPLRKATRSLHSI